MLWEPPEDLLEGSAMARFMRARGHADYDELWRWSVDDLGGLLGGDLGRASASAAPTARCSPTRRCRAPCGSRARRSTTPSTCSAASPTTASRSCTRPSCARSANGRGGSCASRPAAIRAGLVARGVGRGDRVAAYMPNLPETVAAFLATASLGAVWSSAAPEFGAPQRVRPLRPDRAQGAAGDRRLPLRRQGLRPRARPCARSPRRSARRPSGSATSTARGWEEGFLGEPELEFEPVAVRPSAVGALLVAARPACRRRSSRARAASCSSTSRRCTCTSTRGRATACSGSPRRAG